VTAEHSKLVRDRIPEIIAANGGVPVVEVLDGPAVREALLTKLEEEAAELRAALPNEVTEELADILEVVRALAKEFDAKWADVVTTADRKLLDRGGFEERRLLVRVEAPRLDRPLDDTDQAVDGTKLVGRPHSRIEQRRRRDDDRQAPRP
jgi:predicted house-cleaning noncanonical NTP pyrophosphatase (MazG superfamily)